MVNFAISQSTSQLQPTKIQEAAEALARNTHPLNQCRNGLKAELQSIKRFAENFKIPVNSFIKVELKIEQIKRMCEEFEDIQTKIENMDEQEEDLQTNDSHRA